MTLTADPTLLVGFLLALVRTSAWVLIAPPFNTGAIPSRVKIALAAALSLPLAGSLGSADGLLDSWALLGAVVYQVFVGVALGFAVYLVFMVVQAAGELVDFQAGFSAAQLYDPFSNATATPVGRFYELLALTILFASNGHLLLVRGFLLSFKAAPLAGPRLDDLGRVFTHDVSQFLVGAVEIAAPLIGTLFLTELVLGVLGRAAPQLNIMVTGFIVKILLVLVGVGLALPLLPNALSTIVHTATSSMAQLTRG